jgi:hypothetical protein
MARKAKPKAKAMAGAMEAVPVPYKPSTMIDLDEDSVDYLEDCKIGDEVCVIVRGKVVGMSRHESSHTDGKGKAHKEMRGHISIEDPDVCLHLADSEEHAEALAALYEND